MQVSSPYKGCRSGDIDAPKVEFLRRFWVIWGIDIATSSYTPCEDSGDYNTARFRDEEDTLKAGTCSDVDYFSHNCLYEPVHNDEIFPGSARAVSYRSDTSK